MTPPAAATVAGRRAAPLPEDDYVVTRNGRRVPAPVRAPEARPQQRERARPATRPSSRATAAAAALEATLAPAPARTAPDPARTRREAPAPTRTRRETPSRARTSSPRRSRQRTAHAPRLALRLQPPRLDRIVRGRAWIPVLGAMLVAIVGLRVAVLKLGASVGSQIQQATLLESSNTTLRSQISALSDNRRIEKMAAAYGMHMPTPLDVHFVSADAGTRIGAAIHNISAPSNSTFLTALAAEQQNDQASTQVSSSLGAGGASSTGTVSGSAGSTSATTTAGTGSTAATTTATGQTTAGTTSATSTGTTAVAGTSAGSSATATSSAASGSGSAAGTSGLNTGPTNTDAGATASQTTGSTTSTGGSGLAG